ncbi:MAG: hypothetical protein EGQ81_05245 [Akkermansia sp.]|nr:hypothetical protein [Akkermansia sp.]
MKNHFKSEIWSYLQGLVITLQRFILPSKIVHYILSLEISPGIFRIKSISCSHFSSFSFSFSLLSKSILNIPDTT